MNTLPFSPLAASVALNMIFAVIFTADFLDSKYPTVPGRRSQIRLWFASMFTRKEIKDPTNTTASGADAAQTSHWYLKPFLLGLCCGILMLVAAYLCGLLPNRQSKFLLINTGNHTALKMDLRTGQTWYIDRDTQTPVKQ